MGSKYMKYAYSDEKCITNLLMGIAGIVFSAIIFITAYFREMSIHFNFLFTDT